MERPQHLPHQLVRSRFAHTSTIARRVHKSQCYYVVIPKRSPTLFDKIKALAVFAQRDIRYVAIEIGIGGYQPHPAREVFTNRYGDCKDKVTLLGAMLREAGVKSHYVLVHSRRGVVTPEAPSALSFNHMIVAVELPTEDRERALFATRDHERLGRLLFFDPTDPVTPLGYLPPRLQAGHGLLVGDDGGELVEMPLLPPRGNRLLRSGKFRFTEDGSLRGGVHEIRWGTPAISQRSAFLRVAGPERQKVLEEAGSYCSGWKRSPNLQTSAKPSRDRKEAVSDEAVRQRGKWAGARSGAEPHHETLTRDAPLSSARRCPSFSPDRSGAAGGPASLQTGSPCWSAALSHSTGFPEAGHHSRPNPPTLENLLPQFGNLELRRVRHCHDGHHPGLDGVGNDEVCRFRNRARHIEGNHE